MLSVLLLGSYILSLNNYRYVSDMQLFKDLDFCCVNQTVNNFFFLAHDLEKVIPNSLYIPDFFHSNI